MGKATPPFNNRGPVRVTTISTPITPAAPTDTPIAWIQVTSVGSGGLVVKDQGGIARTYASPSIANGTTLYGPFTEITSMTCTEILYGDGPAPPYPPSSSALGSTAAGQGASLVGLEAITGLVGTEVQTGIESIVTSLTSTLGVIWLPAPKSFYLLTGAPLAVFADGSTTVPGSAMEGGKCVGIRWNNDAAPAAVVTSFGIPSDMDITVNAVAHFHVAKTGATNNAGNTTTMAVGLFNQVAAALYDADTDFGGASSALLPAATAKTLQNLTRTITAADLAAYPATVTLTVKPTAGTLDTDDLVFTGCRIVYKMKLRTV